MKRLPLVALFALAPATVAAQTTADLLAQGIKAYEAFNVEGARPIFAQIISPSNINQVSQEQKVTAYKYLGAAHALLAQPDSAVRYFTAALDFDPFTDLDATKFTDAERGPFDVAKQSLFRIGVRPVLPQVVDPRDTTTSYRFQIVTTHRGQVTLMLISQPDSTKVREVLFEGQSDGQRPITWDGRLKSRGGAFADSSVYLLRLTASSGIKAGNPVTETQLLRVEQSFDFLEDTLPTLLESQLLPERIRAREPWFDFAKGFLVGAASYALPAFILTAPTTDNGLKSAGWNWYPHALIGVGISVGSGIASLVYRNANREIPQNIAENRRRKQQRENYNAQIRARNNARRDRTLLIITPINAR